jgi:hypothetical protein
MILRLSIYVETFEDLDAELLKQKLEREVLDLLSLAHSPYGHEQTREERVIHQEFAEERFRDLKIKRFLSSKQVLEQIRTKK